MKFSSSVLLALALTCSPEAQASHSKGAPSDSPTGPPSNLPSPVPSSVPSSEPTSCNDEPNWKVSKEHCSSALLPFVDYTCPQLEGLVLQDEDSISKWCHFLHVNTKVGKSADEACCFCGGGEFVEPPCKDYPQWGLLGFGAMTIDCDFINKNAVDSTEFCEKTKDISGPSTTNGQSSAEACCKCGGGFRPRHDGLEALNETETEDPMDDDETPENKDETAPVCLDKEMTNRVGLGESPGIPNLEYLGLGYDGLRGNPRGSSSSEVDPGFRSRVFSLIQKQDTLSIDREYTVPIGTDFKYTSSCTFESQSKEISSESDYQSSLSSEARMTKSSRTTTSSSFSLSLGFDAIFPPVKGIQAAVSAAFGFDEEESETKSNSFSKSENYNSFRKTSSTSNSVSFEARAVCSEFEIAFNPFAEKTLDPLFQDAMNALPVPYHKENPSHRAVYSQFIDTYGSHYTKQIVLGGKRILSTRMSSKSVSELTKESVDISSALSVEVQKAMSQSWNARFEGTATLVGTQTGGVKGLANAVYNVINPPPKTETPSGSGSLDVSGSSASSSLDRFDEFSRSSKQASDASEIASKKRMMSEVNVGGMPSDDWRVWAASVKEKPMPISYELSGLWNLMSDAKAVAFFQAYKDIEQLEIKPAETNAILDKSHFGVATGTGDSISTYSNANSRAFLQVDQIAGAKEDLASPATLFIGGPESSEKPANALKPDDDTYLACGVRYLRTVYGILKLDMKFCSIDKDAKTTDHEWVDAGGDFGFFPEKFRTNDGREIYFTGEEDYLERTCPKNYFIHGLKLGRCESTGEDRDTCGNFGDKNCCPSIFDRGVAFLQVYCKRLGEGELDMVRLETICISSRSLLCERDFAAGDVKYLPLPAEDPVETSGKTAFGISQYFVEYEDMDSFKSYQYTNGDNKNVGLFEDLPIDQWKRLKSLAVAYKEVVLPDATDVGPSDGIVSYAMTWNGKIDRPTPIFASVIEGHVGRDKKEEDKEFDDIDFQNNMPFGLVNDITSSGTIAMTNFDNDLKEYELRSFSYLTVENDARNYERIVSGVVSNEAVILNDFVTSIPPGFKVYKDSGEATFFVTLTNYDPMPAERPVVIAFPQWYTANGATYPENIAELSLAVGGYDESDDYTFKVLAGSKEATHLGFNFLALKKTASKIPGVSFGTVRTDNTATIEFDPPFEALPSVIVTPIAAGKCGAKISEDQYPQCVVETIEKERAVVKCTCVIDGPDEWLPFNYVAFGPQAPESDCE